MVTRSTGRLDAADSDTAKSAVAPLSVDALRSALVAALDALSVPAFVVAAPDQILMANEAGRRQLERDRAGVIESFRRSLLPRRANLPAPFAVRLIDGGDARVFLAVGRGGDRVDVRRGAQLVGERWRLTARQSDVVGHLAEGLSNRSIATLIGCVEGTVELHVSAILEKAGAASRSEVVARFWRELVEVSG